MSNQTDAILFFGMLGKVLRYLVPPGRTAHYSSGLSISVWGENQFTQFNLWHITKWPKVHLSFTYPVLKLVLFSWIINYLQIASFLEIIWICLWFHLDMYANEFAKDGNRFYRNQRYRNFYIYVKFSICRTIQNFQLEENTKYYSRLRNFMYMYMCVYMHVYVHMCACMCMFVCTCVVVCVCVYMCISVFAPRIKSKNF